MKTMRRYIFDSLALALLAGCIGAGPANAQQASGKFSLPVEAHWNGITLRPGNYSFRFDHPLGMMVLARGQKNLAMILAESYYRGPCNESSLMVEEVNGVNSIRELRLAGADLILRYAPPKSARHKVIEARRLIPVTAQGAAVKRATSIAAPLPGNLSTPPRGTTSVR